MYFIFYLILGGRTIEYNIFQLVSVAEDTGLNLALSETPKTGFVATCPFHNCHSRSKCVKHSAENTNAFTNTRMHDVRLSVYPLALSEILITLNHMVYFDQIVHPQIYTHVQ